MASLNKVILIGRLTRDPVLRYIPNGTPVCNFSLAVNRGFKDGQGQEQTDFIDIVVWSKLAETCSKFLVKGSMVCVEGRLQIRGYESSEGQKRKVAEVVANTVQFLDKVRSKDSYPEAIESDGQMENDEPFDSEADAEAGINPDDIPF